MELYFVLLRFYSLFSFVCFHTIFDKLQITLVIQYLDLTDTFPKIKYLVSEKLPGFRKLI